MKKLLICGAIAASMGMTAAQAGTAVQSFDVKATLSAQCQTNNASTPTIDFGTYTAFTATAPANQTANIAFQCTHGLSPTSVTLSKTTSSVAGLLYTLGVDAGTKTAGSAATATAGATADAWVYVVTGSMGAGQAGDTAAATTDTQTLTIGF